MSSSMRNASLTLAFKLFIQNLLQTWGGQGGRSMLKILVLFFIAFIYWVELLIQKFTYCIQNGSYKFAA